MGHSRRAEDPTIDVITPSAPPPPEPPAEGRAPRCATHVDAEAIAICTRCNRDICSLCHRHDDDGLAHCALCIAKETGQPIDDLMPSSVSTEGAIPLEDRQSPDNIFTRFGQTIRMIVMTPSEFFIRLGDSRAWVQPLVFAIAFVVLRVWMRTFWLLTLDLPGSEELRASADEQGVPFGAVKIGLYIFMPLMAPFIIAMQTGLLHMAARMLGGTADLRKTFQIQAYSNAANLLYIIPVAGDLAAMVVQLIAQTIGLRTIHGLSPGRAAIACVLSMGIWILVCSPIG